METNGTPNNLTPTDALRVLRSILADPQLTPAQKTVTAAVVCQANGQTGEAWASYRQISRDYGVSTSSVAATLKDPGGAAIGTYLAPAGRGRCGAIRYRVLPPSASPSDAPCAAERRASQSEARIAERSAAHRRAKRGASQSEAILALSSGPCFSSPPSPPRGERACSPPAESEEQALARAEAAHREVFGRGLPWSWKRRISREWRKGDRESMAEIDAEALRAGMRLAEAAGRSFGIGWVMRAIADAAARRVAREKAAEGRVRREEAEAEARSREEREAHRQREREAAHFAALSPDRQEAWRRRAAEERFAPKRPDLLERLAAALAWRRHVREAG